jgi:uncharacterized protein involved in exopolysaccharide biosynthesis
MILIIGLLLLVPAAFAIWALPRTYVAVATIVVPSGQRGMIGITQTESPVDATEGLQTEISIMQSEWLLSRTVMSVGDLEVTAHLSERELTGSSREVHERLVRLASERLSVSRVGESRLVRISFSSQDPDFAARFVNAHIAEYISAQTSANSKTLRDLEQSLTEPVAELQESVAQAERAVEQYRAEIGFVDSGETPLVSRQIISLTEQLGAVLTRRVEAEARAQENAGETFRRDVAVLRAQEEALQKALDQLKQEYQQASQAQVRLRQLEADAEINRNLLARFRERQRELQIQSVLKNPSAVILSAAEPPALRASASKAVLMVAAAIGSFGLAFLIGLLAAVRGLGRKQARQLA